MSANSSNWLTPEKIEELLGIKVSTQANMRSQGKIPYSKIGGTIVYQADKIEAWISNHNVPLKEG